MHWEISDIDTGKPLFTFPIEQEDRARDLWASLFYSLGEPVTLARQTAPVGWQNMPEFQ